MFKLTLRRKTGDEDSIARLLAALVKQGINFEAEEQSGSIAGEFLVITFTGGY